MDIQTISVVIAAGTLVVGILNQIDTSRRAAKAAERELITRQAQFFLQIYDNFHREEFFDKFTDIITWKWKDYDDFISKYGRQANPKAWYSLGSVGAFFEGIGVLVHRKIIDAELVGELMSRHVVFFWEKISSISYEMRRRLKSPVDVYLEYLYNQMKPIADKQYSLTVRELAK